MQSKEQLQTLLSGLIHEHLVWICKSHVTYDKKVQLAGLVSVTVDSDPKAIPVRFSHTIERDQQNSASMTPTPTPDAGDADADADADERQVMNMLDQRALDALYVTAEQPEEAATCAKPVGAQKRKSKHSECFKVVAKQPRNETALDLTTRRDSDSCSEVDVDTDRQSPANSAEYDHWRHAETDADDAEGRKRLCTRAARERAASMGVRAAQRDGAPPGERQHQHQLQHPSCTGSASAASAFQLPNTGVESPNAHVIANTNTSAIANSITITNALSPDAAAAGHRNDSALRTAHVAARNEFLTHPGCSDGRAASPQHRRWQSVESADAQPQPRVHSSSRSHNRLSNASPPSSASDADVDAEDDADSTARRNRVSEATLHNGNANANTNEDSSHSEAGLKSVDEAGLVSQMALAMQHLPFLKTHAPSSSAAFGANVEKMGLEYGTGTGTGAASHSHPPASGVTPECHICHTQFDSLPALAVHYDDEHKYIICQYCGKSFSTRQNLRRHERLHTGQRPYVCTVCNQGFYRRDAMMSHMGRSHTDRPGSGYQCTVCRTPSTTYSDKFTFRNHMQKKHGVPDVIFCNECVLAFGDKQAYRDHKAQVHNDSAQAALQDAAAAADAGLNIDPADVKLSDLQAHSKLAAYPDRGLLKHAKMALPFGAAEEELLARVQPAGSLFHAAAAMQNTQALMKQFSELSGNLGLQFGQADLPRLVPPLYPPFAFSQVPSVFPRGLPSPPQGVQRPLGLPFPNELSCVPGLPGLPNLFSSASAVLEQVKLNPGMFEKLLAEMKEKYVAAMREETNGNEELEVNVTDEPLSGDNNNEKLQSASASASASASTSASAKQSPVKRD